MPSIVYCAKYGMVGLYRDEDAFMKPQGYEQIRGALNEAGIQAEVLPVPEEGQDVPYLTVIYEGEPPFVLSSVLNALGAKSLMHDSVGRSFRDPSLKFLAQDHVFVTFQDYAAKSQLPKNGSK